MRWDVAVRTSVHFSLEPPGVGSPTATAARPFAIRFEGRDFTWHPATPNPHVGFRGPVVSVMTESSSDYLAEMLAMERLLSGLSYVYSAALTVVNSAGASWPGPFDPPVAIARGGDSTGVWYAAPARLEVLQDDRLRLVLALYREGRSAESPFYRFLSYWNAIDAVFDTNEKTLDSFIAATPARAAGWFHGHDVPKVGWPKHFRESNRNAIAHAVRDKPDRPVRDPDSPTDRSRLTSDARLLEKLLRSGIEERWGALAAATLPHAGPKFAE